MIAICLKSFIHPEVITEMAKFRPCIHPSCEFCLGCRGAVKVGPECDEEKVPPAIAKKPIITSNQRYAAIADNLVTNC